MVTKEVIRYGSIGAVIMELLRKREADSKWVRMPLKELTEIHPEISMRQVEYAINKLRKVGVIERNRYPDDNAIYYRIKKQEVVNG